MESRIPLNVTQNVILIENETFPWKVKHYIYAVSVSKKILTILKNLTFSWTPSPNVMTDFVKQVFKVLK